ncbi:TolC family protein [Burkholderiaceae bacterium UC74_6]
MNHRLTPLGVALAISLAGCASFSGNGGLQPVQEAAQRQLGKDLPLLRTTQDEQRTADRVRELLAQPLNADSAVQIALLNNRGLQASLQEIGVAEADLVQASRLPNPGFGFARLKQGSEVELDRGFSFDIARLITLPMARGLEAQRFTATQRGVTLEMFKLAAETRKAFYAAAAAEQIAGYQQEVQGAADAGAELAQRMVKAGNWSTLQQAREQGFATEAALAVARAEQQRVASRERLTRLLGLPTSSGFSLPERLPDLPVALSADPALEQAALDQRLDIQQAKSEVETQARSLGLTRSTRFINLLELGYQRNSMSGLPRQTGYELRVEVPLFDWGDARVQRAEALYMQTVQRAAQVAIDARSELREAVQQRRSSFEIARRCRDELVPLAKRVSEENQLRYNGMFISVFELLADARAQVAAVNAALEAQRDFWIAQAELDMATIGTPIRR